MTLQSIPTVQFHEKYLIYVSITCLPFSVVWHKQAGSCTLKSIANYVFMQQLCLVSVFHGWLPCVYRRDNNLSSFIQTSKTHYVDQCSLNIDEIPKINTEQRFSKTRLGFNWD